MRYFIDTEFSELGPGKPITLLSLAIVAEDGREYYRASMERMREAPNVFVQEQVMPEIMRQRNKGNAVPRLAMAQEIRAFIGDDPSPEFWADYGAYDWVLFCQVFGTMVDLPKGWPMYVNELQQLGRPNGTHGVDAGTPHCALDDARQVKKAYEWATRPSTKQQTPGRRALNRMYKEDDEKVADLAMKKAAERAFDQVAASELESVAKAEVAFASEGQAEKRFPRRKPKARKAKANK